MEKRSRILSIRKKAKDTFALAPFSVAEKGNLSNVVTSNDKAIQAFLVEKLSDAFPGCGFICEENDVCEIKGKDSLFLIDPIDGTRNYTRKSPVCAISVALEEKGEVVLGAVRPLFTDEVYYAEKGKGAFYNGERIHVSSRKREEGILLTSFNSYYKELSSLSFEIVQKVFPRINDIRRLGACSVELCKIAKGEEDRFYELTLNPWDYAAGGLVLTEAGGFICARDGKRPDYRSKTLIVAGNTLSNREEISHVVSQVLNTRGYQG